MNSISKLNELQSIRLEEGQRVKALYLGEYQIQGTIIEKRTKYGWKTQYRIQIEEDLVLPFRAGIAYFKDSCLAVDNDNVIEVL